VADEVVGALITRRLPFVKPQYLAHIRDLFIRLLVSDPRTASCHLGSMAKAAVVGRQFETLKRKPEPNKLA
jgi:hypothetical protein